jgi:imidazolonepropionase-like amidohydrolase
MGERICLANARVVDVARGVVLPEVSVLIENGCIAAFLEAPLEALLPRTFEARGLYLAPGLIDGHAHFALDGGDDPRNSFLAADEQSLWETGRGNARRAIQAGITSVRDCGAPAPWIFAFQRKVARGGISGPHVLSCGHPLTRPRGHLHFFGGEVSTRQEVRSAVERLAAQGACFIKLVASGGGLTSGTKPGRADLPLELMREAAEVAHGLGIGVASHCHATESIRRALDAGLDTIEHASFTTPAGDCLFEDDTARRIRDQGTAVCPTVIGALRTVRRFRESKMPHHDGDAAAVARLEARQTNIARFCRLGLPLLGGTDCGITDTPFDSLLDELLLYQ